MNGHQIARLADQLEELGFRGKNLYGYLEEFIEAAIPEIPLYQRKRIGEDEVSYDVLISRNTVTGDYYIDNYAATLLQTHPIEHRQFEGIDTAQLEKNLRAVNWQEYDKTTHIADGQQVLPLMEQVFRLAQSDSPGAQDISARLQLRYWLYTPVEQQYNVGKYYDLYARSHVFQLSGGLADIHPREAYNLLSGRGVLKFHREPGQEHLFRAHWKVLDGSQLKTLPDYDLSVSMLPVRELQDVRTGPSAVYDLIRGERIQVHFMGSSEAVFMEADPRNRSFAFYDVNLKKLDNKEVPGMAEFARQAKAGRKQQTQNSKRKGRSL